MAAEGAAPALNNDRSMLEKALDGIESLGNKVPHPAIIFVGLCVLVILLSQVLDWMNVSVTYDVISSEPTPVEEQDLTGSSVPGVDYPSNFYGD
ncbi:MAG: AbgT family transporter, partial [Dehalococcoidia bacterium]